MAKNIGASVGRMGGMNRPPDVKVVQELLNNVPISSGGPVVKLIVNGNCGNDTKDAIYRFQFQHFGNSAADGRVDPGGPTLRKLNEFDTSVSPPGGLPPPPGSQQVIGKIESTLGTVHFFDLTTGAVPRQAAVGMNIKPYMSVKNADNNSFFTIRLASGSLIMVNGNQAILSFN